MAYHLHIPKIIHQIWLGNKPRPQLWMDSWKKNHPDWEYHLWTESNLPKLYNQKQFDLVNSYPGKSDILRLELLWHYGGIYIDADSESLKPLDDALRRYHFFACYENKISRPGIIANGVIGCEPEHPLVADYMKAINKIEEINSNKAWILTGPMLFTKVIRQYNALHKPVALLPSHLFFPYHFTLGYYYKGRGKIYAVEHWQTTHNELNMEFG